MKFFLLLSIALTLACPAHARAACGSEQINGLPLRYCESGQASDTVLYFFHSATGSEQQWDSKGPLGGDTLKNEWTKLGIHNAAVLSISFGPYWVLNKDSAKKLADVLPALEKRLYGAAARKRLAFGTSMGGLNAGLLSLHNPGLFEKTAMLCPAVSTLSPFASAHETSAFASTVKSAKADGVQIYQQIFAPLYGSESRWQSERLDKNVRSPYPTDGSFFLGINDRDQMGFAPAGEALYRNLLEKGFTVSRETVRGAHCKAIFTPAVARFLR